MPEDRTASRDPVDPLDVGAYCRDVETHLTKVNGGHLVRVVGPGFELVRRWAAEGIPLSIVHRAIEQKAARHQAGASRRALRIEFCEEDVEALFAEWRRAVGMPTVGEEPTGPADEPVADEAPQAERRAASQALDRAIERLSRGAGRLDWPERLREVVSARLSALTALRAELKGTRGEARAALLAHVSEAEPAFSEGLLAAAPATVVQEVRASAARELAGYRNRLAPEAWERAVKTTADRLLRDRLGLPLP